MHTPQQVIESEFLESRCSLLEIAATFDRHDAAMARTGEPAGQPEKQDCLRKALALLAKPELATNRTEQLLHLFATV